MPNKFCSLDPLPTWLLKECFDELHHFLLNLVNLSLKHGIVPKGLKAAVIKPTVKDFKTSPDELSNYRPVSNLPFLSKLLEKAVSQQLNKHLTSN